MDVEVFRWLSGRAAAGSAPPPVGAAWAITDTPGDWHRRREVVREKRLRHDRITPAPVVMRDFPTP
jgi:hypothetical protein